MYYNVGYMWSGKINKHASTGTHSKLQFKMGIMSGGTWSVGNCMYLSSAIKSTYNSVFALCNDFTITTPVVLLQKNS